MKTIEEEKAIMNKSKERWGLLKMKRQFTQLKMKDIMFVLTEVLKNRVTRASCRESVEEALPALILS